MQVVLVRHAIAYEHDRKRWPDDNLRPLTPEGMEQFREAAAGLSSFIETPEKLLSSSLVRTKQTAQLLVEVAGWPVAEEAQALTPLGTPTAVLELLNKQSAMRIALVGHEPNLSELAAVALGGVDSKIAIEMKKGAALCLEFLGTARPGRATLR